MRLKWDKSHSCDPDKGVGEQLWHWPLPSLSASCPPASTDLVDPRGYMLPRTPRIRGLTGFAKRGPLCVQVQGPFPCSAPLPVTFCLRIIWASFPTLPMSLLFYHSAPPPPSPCFQNLVLLFFIQLQNSCYQPSRELLKCRC